jgi:predicted transcriptional regulator of viral defense system
MAVLKKRIVDLLRRRGTVQTAELVDAGMTRSELSRMVVAGQLVRVARGLYALPEYQQTEYGTLALVAKRVPGVLFCLLTALRFHDLTTQSPFEVWIAIGNKAWAPELDYPRLRVIRFSQESLSEGVERHRVEGTEIRVTSVAKTIADCFKFRNKVGMDVALEGLRDARRSGRASAEDLWHFAKLNRVDKVMRPYLEAVE